MEDAVGQGMIVGGWEYVWLVYGATWAVVVTYTAIALSKAQKALSPAPEAPR